MSGSYLLDTNIIIGLFAGQASIINHLQKSDEVFIPSIALGELHYGARKSGRVQQNLERIEEFVADVIIIDCNAATARHYGDVKNRLRVKGRPLPENDIWIAALALQYGLVLVTRDAHFQHVEGLQTVRW
ncbi:MAG: type II toxin-antitoxin system VapC family toxin [Cyanobacteria bacterium P01_A01_bin.123]